MSHLIARGIYEEIAAAYAFLGDSMEFHAETPAEFSGYVMDANPQRLSLHGRRIAKPRWWGLPEEGRPAAPLALPEDADALLLPNEGNDPARYPHPPSPEELAASALARARAESIPRIDAITEERILSSGFQYPPGSGQIFSTSKNAQTNWIARVLSVQADPSLVLSIPTRDSSALLQLSAAQVIEAYRIGTATIAALLASGEAVRQACRAASSPEEIEEIIREYEG